MARERRPTLRDVASLAGVSFKTVSRVVNNEPGVSANLTSQVEAAIATLNYRPDDRARRLRQSASGPATIGFVLVDLSNPFSSRLLRGTEQATMDRGCLVLAGSSEGSAGREQHLIEAFLRRRVDGLMVVSSQETSASLRSEVERGTPIVFLDREPRIKGADLVRSDHYGGAYEATRHLQRQGHTDIAYLGDDLSIQSARLRLEGFLDAMTAAGLSVDLDRIVTASKTETDWLELVETFLGRRPRPTALFTAQNFVTVGAVRALHGLGLHHEIAQVGFDDVELGDVAEPGISVIRQDPLAIGRRGAELLLARIDGDIGPPITEVMSTPLIERGSGELRPRDVGEGR